MATTYRIKSRTENGNESYSDDFKAVKTVTKEALSWAKDAKPGEQIYVTWHRAADGQKGYLNADGGHDITGKPWPTR